MKRIMVGCAAVMILGLAAWVSAQVPADRQYLAFQWPDDCLPVIDGDISEWYAIPEVYAIKLEDLVDAFGAAADKSSCDPYGWLAYNPNDDYFYMASRVYDDFHDRSNEDPAICNCFDDNYEFVIDADFGFDTYGGDVPEGATQEEIDRLLNSKMQWYSIAAPPVAGQMVQGGGKATWALVPPYFEVAITSDPPGQVTGDVESTYFYEMRLRGWDDLDYNGPETSVMTDLVEGERFLCNVIWSDYDWAGTPETYDQYDGYWRTGGWCCDASQGSEFLLAPVDPDFVCQVAVEKATWGRLKSRFVD